jgi:broad specificity phosphatase PhoE
LTNDTDFSITSSPDIEAHIIMDKEFYLIRHAQSMGNIGMDTGYDADLSPLGHAQAKQCATFMLDYCDDATLILSSPFERCLITAEAIAIRNSLTIKIIVALHELFAREWFPMKRVKLLSLAEKAKQHPLVIGDYDNHQWWPNDNETQQELEIRMAMLRNRLLSNTYDAAKIICIGHWASIASLAHAMVPDVDMPFVDNAAVTKIDYDDGEFLVDFINKTE